MVLCELYAKQLHSKCVEWSREMLLEHVLPLRDGLSGGLQPGSLSLNSPFLALNFFSLFFSFLFSLFLLSVGTVRPGAQGEPCSCS